MGANCPLSSDPSQLLKSPYAPRSNKLASEGWRLHFVKPPTLACASGSIFLSIALILFLRQVGRQLPANVGRDAIDEHVAELVHVVVVGHRNRPAGLRVLGREGGLVHRPLVRFV